MDDALKFWLGVLMFFAFWTGMDAANACTATMPTTTPVSRPSRDPAWFPPEEDQRDEEDRLRPCKGRRRHKHE